MSTGDADPKPSAGAAGGAGRPPPPPQQQLRKSRTISSDGQTAPASGSTAAFHKPLFPAIRRASSGPLPPPTTGPGRLLTVAVDDPSDAPLFHGPLFPAVRRVSSGLLQPPPAGPARRLTVAVDDPADSPLFQGPLFPAVRRAGSGPLPPRLTVAVDDPADGPANAGVLDRDWCYPSFLGPYPSRQRSAARATLPKPEPPKAENTTALARQRVPEKEIAEPVQAPPKSVQPIQPPETEKRKPVLSLPSSALSRGTRRASSYLILCTLVMASLLSASVAFHQRIRVLELEEEIVNIRRMCNGNENASMVSDEILQSEDTRFHPYTRETDSRTVAFYTTMLSVVVPFVLFRFLEHIPSINSYLKGSKNNEEEVPLKKRIAYRVDVFFSVYPYAKLLALLCAIILLIGYGGLALYAVSESSLSEALWLSWTFVADSGNHAEMVGLGPRFVSVSISSGGMLIFAMMLGLVSDAISEKVDSWRKGKSEVIEKNHILILGWSDKLGSLLKQLAIANKSIGGGVIVVLAERDKEEMEMDISKLEFDFMGTSVICRSGSPLILADLKKVSVSKARAIIVLASDENADQSDARALRVVLSLTGVKEGLRGHVVVEMSDLDNEPLVKLVGEELIETVVAHDVIGRLMIQCALQPGLAQNSRLLVAYQKVQLLQIWEDILGFENAEFYIKRWPQLDGMRFEDVLISFPDAVPCGVKMAANGGNIVINPDDDYVLKEGDEVLVIAEDDDTYTPGPLPEMVNSEDQEDEIPLNHGLPRGFMPLGCHCLEKSNYLLFSLLVDVNQILMVRSLLPSSLIDLHDRSRVIRSFVLISPVSHIQIRKSSLVLEAFLPSGSELWMFNDVPIMERKRKLNDGGLDISGLSNITLVHKEGNAVIRRHLESLPLETFDSEQILILADESVEDSVVHSDSRSLATLLLIRAQDRSQTTKSAVLSFCCSFHFAVDSLTKMSQFSQPFLLANWYAVDILQTRQSKRLPSKGAKSAPLRYAGFSHSSWIREMQQASDKSIIISEILDSRTRNLVSVSRISDYVLSNELVSMALAMVAEDKQINRVLEELFAEEEDELPLVKKELMAKATEASPVLEGFVGYWKSSSYCCNIDPSLRLDLARKGRRNQGNELCIRPAEYFLYDQEELCFYEIMVRGRERQEIVIGYRLANADRAIINPPQKLEKRKWSLDDVFVVISIGD
ncbi:putative ion channel POLLUX [Apostasia shenzhenica]|uniref:Putative ion channel POLLUX n=1 Tax=Apostasia shenzhenica TaxID=1088818 RepID=A0A2I0AHB6_9ASPA|nr:putative ion channel POLLUX [Apostasia shenzhenica]